MQRLTATRQAQGIDLTPSLAALGLPPLHAWRGGDEARVSAPSRGEVNQRAAEQRPTLTGFARTLRQPRRTPHADFSVANLGKPN